MKQKKPWILRPVSWVCTVLMMILLEIAATLICLLGEYFTYKLSTLSTIGIVILVMAFGSTFVGLFFYSITYLSALLVELSDKIYPSHHAFRFYFFGLYEILGCVLHIISALIGNVKGDLMFWFYARYVWLIIASISVMLGGRAAANEVEAKIANEVTTKTANGAPTAFPLRSPSQAEPASYNRLLKVLQIGAGAKDVDSAISMFSSFYLRKGVQIPSELFENVDHLTAQEKYEKLIKILEVGTGVAGIENVTRRFVEFYTAKGIVFPDDIL